MMFRKEIEHKTLMGFLSNNVMKTIIWAIYGIFPDDLNPAFFYTNVYIYIYECV